MARRYLMIGAPVTSVRTPPLLEAFMAENGIDARMDVQHVEPHDLASVMNAAAANPTIDGLMVTMPHKRAIVDHLSAVTDVAAQAGSVNAVKRLGGRFVGAQFDGIALRSALDAKGVARGRIWLAGLGGAGLAIAQALVAGGCETLFVSETDPARVAQAEATLGATIVPPGERVDADALVNATPLGMAPGDKSPFPATAVSGARVVADIVADPNETQLAALARDSGVPLVTGRMMVAHQIAPIGHWLLSDALRQPA